MKPEPNKFEGCLLGLAIGDAMGMPFEGWRPHWIRRKVGGRLDTFIPSATAWRTPRASRNWQETSTNWFVNSR